MSCLDFKETLFTGQSQAFLGFIKSIIFFSLKREFNLYSCLLSKQLSFVPRVAYSWFDSNTLLGIKANVKVITPRSVSNLGSKKEITGFLMLFCKLVVLCMQWERWQF